VDDEQAGRRPAPSHAGRPRTPLWVKIFGLSSLSAVVVFVVLHLTGYGMGGH
jgi:hypothetical protein